MAHLPHLAGVVEEMVASVGRITAGRGYDYLNREVATFELGDLTGQQAFAAATQRDPAGQLSAHSIQQRWQTGAADRTAARAADRKRRQVTDWWTARERGLPPAMRAAIAGRHSVDRAGRHSFR